ncbi:MAG: septation protein SepH [Rhodoglobus sp.]
MQDLRVIGVESGALLVAADDGTRFRIPIDEMMQSKLRQSVADPGAGPKLSPREIQAHIRSGMSAQDVASITGASFEYIQRFEGPVIAERDFVVQSALGVPVKSAADADPMNQGRNFGSVIRDRLHELGATDERWASWKDPEAGWIVKLAFTAKEIDHDARWGFDPKKQSLSPNNGEAVTLSRQGENGGGMMPRLRAVSEPAIDTADPDPTRFDSGAFTLSESQQFSANHQSGSEPVAIGRRTEEPVHGNQTSDLLEALRRRRGEREAAHFDEAEARGSHPSTGSIRIVDVPMEIFDEEPEEPRRTTSPQPAVRRKARASMPSWDEIVFGARPDDDPA